MYFKSKGKKLGKGKGKGHLKSWHLDDAGKHESHKTSGKSKGMRNLKKMAKGC